jgi:hypothetical protein
VLSPDAVSAQCRHGERRTQFVDFAVCLPGKEADVFFPLTQFPVMTIMDSCRVGRADGKRWTRLCALETREAAGQVHFGKVYQSRNDDFGAVLPRRACTAKFCAPGLLRTFTG